MLVKDLMAKPVITVSNKITVGEALELTEKHDIRHLPVVNAKQAIVGVTSQKDLLKVFPKTSDCKNPFERNLLSRTPITKVMVPNPYYVNPEVTVEEAALVMKKHKIGCLPVVENNKVVGLVSRSDVFEAFITSLGLAKEGVRLTIPYRKKMGFLSKLITIADEFGVIIEHMVTFEREIVIKVQPEKVEPFVKKLKASGYTVTDLTCIKASASRPCT